MTKYDHPLDYLAATAVEASEQVRAWPWVPRLRCGSRRLPLAVLETGISSWAERTMDRDALPDTADDSGREQPFILQ
jgi:hypothetical protein